MLLYFMTLFIFWFYSYKKLKMDLFNIYIILYRFHQIKFQPTIDGNKNPINPKSIKAKKTKRKKNNNNSSNDIFINFNIKKSLINNYYKTKQMNNVR